ncbi:MAG TPA: luciferase family protein [Candidatus Obscuribacterales bacterium]
MTQLRKQLIQKLLEIEGLEERASTVAGGSALFYKGKEIAHFHNDHEIDVRLTKEVIKKEGLTHPIDSEVHSSRKPGSQWFEIRFRSAAQVEEAVRLFKLACQQY